LTELLLELYVVSDGAFAARMVRQALQHGADLPLGGFDLGMERAGGDAQRPVAEDDDLLGAVGRRHAHAAFAAQLVGRALDVGAERRSAGNVDRLRLFLIAAHDCRGHGEEKDGHADDRTNDSCDSFHNAVSLPRWDSGAAQNVIDLFLAAKREQRSFRARCPSAALSDVHLWGHASGFDV